VGLLLIFDIRRFCQNLLSSDQAFSATLSFFFINLFFGRKEKGVSENPVKRVGKNEIDKK
jgi:hypothetical protein